MEIFKESRGLKYTTEIINNGDYEGVNIDVNGIQVVRIERNAMTGERFVYVWDGQDEDYSEKVQFFPFKNKGEKTDKEKLETVYFAVVDTYDGLTGEPILKNEEVILSENIYRVFKDYPENDDVYIHWSEEYEVIQLDVNEYLLVNLTDMGGNVTKDVYERFKTEPLGDIERFIG